MPSPSNSVIAYTPGPVPPDPRQLQRYLREEFEKIAAAIKALADGHLETTYRAPVKPREGDIRLSDGTEWDPVGAAASRFVGYRAGAWKELG